MDKVVILARVSTDKQEYQRQVNELTDYCSKVGWSVEAVFSNQVIGANRLLGDLERLWALREIIPNPCNPSAIPKKPRG